MLRAQTKHDVISPFY